MSPLIVMEGDAPVATLGAPGGAWIGVALAQVLVNLLDFGMNPQAAGDAARVRHGGSAEPTGAPADSSGGTVYVESGISDAAVAQLRKLGHQVVRQRGGYGGYQGILIDWQNGTLVGASESRKDGNAAGW